MTCWAHALGGFLLKWFDILSFIICTQKDFPKFQPFFLKWPLHVIWFIRAWFKRVFQPSTGFVEKIRVSSTGFERRKGSERLLQVLLNWKSNKHSSISHRERQWKENIMWKLCFMLYHSIKVKMNKGYFRVSSTGFRQNN